MYYFNLRRNRRLFLSALGFNLLILSSCLHSKEDEEKPSTAAADNANKVLMITGGKAHDYDTLPRKLAEVLAKTGKINIHVASNLSALTSDNIKTCDVLMFNNCEDTNLDETQRQLILEALRQGKGLVAMHCALYSFQGWPEWRKIVGAVVNKHDPYTTFDVAVVDSQSSITTDVPRQFSISDEPYLAEEWIEDNHVLVQTVKPHGKRDKPEPMAWTTRYAGGHVFSIMFGHDVKAQENPAFLALLANGIHWATGQSRQPTMLSEKEEAEGFVPLFDGKTMNGWHYDPDLWRVQQGVIVGNSRPRGLDNNSFAIYDKPFDDFILRLSVRFISGNTGVQFRSTEGPKYTVSGYQADVVLPTGWGNLHEQDGRRRLVDGWTGKAEQFVNAKNWNEMEIIAQGRHIILKTNGLVTADYTETDNSRPLNGIIALQLHRGDPMKVEFTNIRIKPLTVGTSRPGSM